MKKKIVYILGSAAVVFGLTGCGQTSAFSTYNSYVHSVGKVLSSLKPSGSDTDKEEAATAASKTPLDTPENFTVEGDASFAFTGVENASSYQLFLYDEAGNTVGDGVITPNDTNEYSGNLTEYVTFGFGKYTASVSAYAGRTSDYSDSSSTSAEYIYSGELSAPQIEYEWAEGAMSLQLANAADYATQAVPDEVVITAADLTEDEEATFTFKAEDIDASSDQNFIEDDQFFVNDHAYAMTAYAVSSNEYVTNARTETVQVTESETLNAAGNTSAGYSKQQAGPGGGGDWGIKAPAEISFESGAESFEITFGEMDAFKNQTAALTESTEDGIVYTYALSNGDAGWPFDWDTKITLSEDGEALLTWVGGGPLSAGRALGSWTEADGVITVVW